MTNVGFDKVVDEIEFVARQLRYLDRMRRAGSEIVRLWKNPKLHEKRFEAAMHEMDLVVEESLTDCHLQI